MMSIFGPPAVVVSRQSTAKPLPPVTYSVTLREPSGRIHWQIEVEPHLHDERYENAKRVTVIDCVTFAGDYGTVGEPVSDSEALSQGMWLYREYREEIDALVRVVIEKNREWSD